MSTRRRGAFQSIAGLFFLLICAAALSGACLLAIPAPAFASSSSSAYGQENDCEAGQVLVRFNASASAAQKQDIVASVGSLALGYELADHASQIVLVELGEGISINDACVQLRASNAVAAAQPNIIYPSTSSAEATDFFSLANGLGMLSHTKVNDPYAQNLTKISGANQWGLGCTNAFDAWDYARCDGKVTVAVLDTGANMTHEDLKTRINKNYAYDAVTRSRMLDSYTDWIGTGTAECGIIAGQVNNGLGIAGISYNADLLPVNIYDYESPGLPLTQYTTSAYLAAAYEHLFEAKKSGVNVRVVMIGLAQVRHSMTTADFMLQQLISEAKEDYGIVTVAGAGDGDNYEAVNTSVYPSDCPEVVSVIPLFDEDTHNDVFCYGPNKNISAPGKDITTTSSASNNTYKKYSGSKYAASFVAGSLALLFAVNPDLSVDEATGFLYSTAVDLGDEGFDQYYGWGRLNVSGAVAKAVESNSDYINIMDAAISVAQGSVYTGLPVTPKVSVNYKGRTLVEGVDYALSYANNVNVGTAQVTVSGIGNASSSQTLDFEIAKAPAPRLVVEDIVKTYDGAPAVLAPSLEGDIPGTTFEFRYPDGSYRETCPHMSQAGRYTVDVRAVNPNFETAYASASVVIDPAPIVIRVRDCEKYAGSADPEFSYDIEGNLADDRDLGKIAVVRDTADANKENAGDRIVLKAVYDSNPNYAITCIDGVLSIVSYGDKAPVNDFTDVDPNDWYVTQGWFSYVVQNGIMSGYADGSGRFGAYDSITRGQLVTMLYRVHTGETAETTNNTVSAGFSDVPSGYYCAAAVKWANKNQIVTGYDGTGEFRPDNAATRAEMVTIVARYAKFAGVDTSQFDRDEFLVFSDSPSVASWARPSFAWCVSAGLISGIEQSDGSALLAPSELSQRAQAAKVVTVLLRDVLGK